MINALDNGHENNKVDFEHGPAPVSAQVETILGPALEMVEAPDGMVVGQAGQTEHKQKKHTRTLEIEHDNDLFIVQVFVVLFIGGWPWWVHCMVWEST